ncbi:hypothetical protein PCASD_18442 [Puccinia coronata f. sp. avenae]|uniref:Uncharacterized protein n=1 Tax=Puccinia coronata f. sp. avenae TaxID=200324 RepID=A0A2N5TYZ4_9BASI|nr:hypothetical protein PCASD_18442 [Puccinia coronata f. sp. avenae]
MPGKISPRFVPLLVFSLLVVYCSYCLASERPSLSGWGKGPWDAAQTGKVGDVGSASSTTKQAETKVHFDQDESRMRHYVFGEAAKKAVQDEAQRRLGPEWNNGKK